MKCSAFRVNCTIITVFIIWLMCVKIMPASSGVLLQNSESDHSRTGKHKLNHNSGQNTMATNQIKSVTTGTEFQSTIELSELKFLNYVKFVDNDIIFNPHPTEQVDGYQNLIILLQEAHTKFKFENGVIYIHISDQSYVDDLKISPKFYFVSYHIQYQTLFDRVTGPCYSFNGWPSAQIQNFTETTAEIMRAGDYEPMVRKLGSCYYVAFMCKKYISMCYI